MLKKFKIAIISIHFFNSSVLLPLIVKESGIVRKRGGKLIVAGFSQGCGMSIHCLFSRPDLVDGAIGIAG